MSKYICYIHFQKIFVLSPDFIYLFFPILAEMPVILLGQEYVHEH